MEQFNQLLVRLPYNLAVSLKGIFDGLNESDMLLSLLYILVPFLTLIILAITVGALFLHHKKYF